MSQFIPFGGGSVPNPDGARQYIGFGTPFTGTAITTGGANGKGTNTSLGGTTSGDVAGYFVWIGPSGGSTRLLIDIRDDAGNLIFPNLYAMPGTTGWRRIWISQNIASGTALYAQAQANTATATVQIGIECVLRNSTSPPLWDTVTALAVDTTNTRASTVSVPLHSSASWTTIVASTAAAYGALTMISGATSSAPATAQSAAFLVGVGGTPATVMQSLAQMLTSGVTVSTVGNTLEATIPISSVLSGDILANTPGSDTGHIALYGYS